MADPKAGHGSHHFNQIDFGIDATQVDQAVGAYYEHYERVKEGVPV